MDNFWKEGDWIGYASRFSALLLSICCPVLWCAQKGFECVHGNASLAELSESGAKILSTGKSVIHWEEFSILSGQKVRFEQAGINPCVLNRVIGGNASHLLGELFSNGSVFLINPNGVFIGPEGRIETSGFLASTLDVLDSDFLSGKGMLFVKQGEKGKIVHEGKIHCPSGDVYLFASQVENHGDIAALDGCVGLGAGSHIFLAVEGQNRIFIQAVEGEEGEIDHLGKIQGISVELQSQGSPYACAIRSSGEIDAATLVAEEGRIFLKGLEGKVVLNGEMKAPFICASGEEVHVLENARIDGSVSQGGGEILIGGGLRGEDLRITNAKRTYVQKGALISANALDEGNGGSVVVWSEEHTIFEGHAEAKGIDRPGFIEVSGKRLGFSGTTDLRSITGEVGTLLLDPQNIVIDPAGGVFVGPTDPFGNNVGGTDTFTGASLASVINTSAVILQANTDITFNDNVTTAAGAVGSLTLQAGRSILFNSGISVALTDAVPCTATINDAGAIPADRVAGDATFFMDTGSSLTTVNGNIGVGFGSFGGTAEGFIQISGATVTSTSGSISIAGQGYGAAAVAPNNTGITIEGASLIRAGGSVDLTGTAGNATAASADGVSLSGTSIVRISGSSDLTITGSVPAGATVGATTGIVGTLGVQIESLLGSSGNIILNGTNATSDTGSAGLNHGIHLNSQVSSLGSGGIQMNGVGSPNSPGNSNHGVFFTTPARVTSQAGDIEIEGYRGGSGVSAFSTGVRVTGNILITGFGTAGVSIQAPEMGSANPTGTDSAGIKIESAGLVCLISTVNGDIEIDGVGSTMGGTTSHGVWFLNTSLGSGGGLLTLGSGDISVIGLAHSGNPSYGIEMENSSFRATGTGNITCTGTRDISGTGQRNSGFHFALTAPTINVIRAIDGDIELTGIGGGGGGSQECDGLYISGGAFMGGGGFVETLGTGDITLTGTARSTGAAGGHNGVFIDVKAVVRTTGSGLISIDGTGSNSSSGPENNGVRIAGGISAAIPGGQVQSISGPITITGTAGSGVNTNNRGVVITEFGDVISTGTATISITGTGGGGSPNNTGIEVSGADSSITSSGTGAVTLVGNGGAGGIAAANQNQGVRVSSSGLITSVAGTLSITGTGGGNGLGTNNIGIDVDTGGDITSTGSALLLLTGTGGNGTSANSGIQVDGAGSTISATMGGTIELHGFGSSQAAAASQNQGIRLTNSGVIQAANGSIVADGRGGGNGMGSNNVGIDIESAGQILSTGTASINATGIGGVGTSTNYGVQIFGLGSQIASSLSGPITVIGNIGSSTLEDIVIEQFGSVLSSTSGAVQLHANRSDLLIQDGGSVFSNGTGTVTANAINDVRLEGGVNMGEVAQIHVTSGNAFINAQGDVLLTGGSGDGAYAQIGNNALGSPPTASIFVTAQGNVSVDGTNLNSYAVIGHGNPSLGAPMNLTGNITVQAFDVLIDGADAGAGALGFGQIGHVNSLTAATTLAGNIFIDVRNDILLTGGNSSADAYARVGHGGLLAGIAPTVSGNILMIADVDIILTSNPIGQAQVQNLGPGSVICVVDDLYPTTCLFGPGQFILSEDSLIETTGGELRIYTVMPAQNTIDDLLNGAMFIPGPYNVNTTTETWSTYYPNGSYGGQPFNLYYKIPCIIPEDDIDKPITDLSVYNAQLVPLLPSFLPFNYEDYPYHPKLCIQDWIKPFFWSGKEGKVIRTNCEPTFIRYKSMIFENYLE